MIKKILKPFKSMSVITFVTDIFCFCLASVIILLAGVAINRSDIIDNTRDSAAGYLDELSDKLVLNAYFVNSSENTAMNSEMYLMADKFDGRILVINSDLKCIFDTYNVETDKTFVSSDVINALKDISGEKRDDDLEIIELYHPIKSTPSISGDSELKGVIIFSFSIADAFSVSDRLGKSLHLLVFPCIILMIFVGSFHARYVTSPIKTMTKSLNHVSEGYFDDKLEIRSFKEYEDMTDAVNNMLSKLNSMENSRQEFVSNVSHELKTPLTSIKILADSLVQQPEAPLEVYQEFLGDINAEIDRENRIITDLLELVKLDRKNGEMHIAMVSINELLEILMKRIKPIAQSHNVDMIYESHRKVDAEVDEVKLTLAISNLVENAVKYNKEGGWVKVTLDSDHRYFVVTVSDSGIGIPEESLNMIFDRFYRVDKMRARKTGGTGLGLSITKSVILMHNGQLKVESKEGEGTTFICKIPMSFIEKPGIE